MKKRARIFTLIALTLLSSIFLSNLISAQSIDSSIKKMTNVAEQYETGSINYAQLIVYMSSLSKEMAIIMGADSGQHDQTLKQEQLENALGSPTESTQWVWVEGEEREKKIDKEVPAWRKIIFDGKETQIYLSAWPSFSRSDPDKIIYRLHHDINFKSKSQEIDIESEIEKVKSLALEYSSNPTSDNLERLAEGSVNIEQTFNNQPYKNSLKCEANMNNLFGSENKRDSQKIIAQEIDFVDGEKFQSKIRLEICDDCEWHWINMNMWVDSRGKSSQIKDEGNSNSNRQQYESYSIEDFKREIQETISNAKSDLQNENFKEAMQRMQQLRPLLEVWNEKSNNVWEQFQDQYKIDFETMTQEEREECSKTYCWIKKDQERMIAQRSLQDKNHEERKQFFLNLFSEYDKKESYFSQDQWEKRLFEQFKEFGEEICTNNLDDNNNQQIDCAENQCSGKICGSETVSVVGENGQTTQEARDLYCIAGTCQAKAETNETSGPVCGNNICEENETASCSSDCAICASHEAISCDGTAIFSGVDASSCPLAPICLTETTTCETDNDCTDPLCGDSSCIEGTCQLTQLTECREPECTDGDEEIISCSSGERVVDKLCFQGIWKDTNVECPQGEEIIEGETPVVESIEGVEVEQISESVVGNACTVKSDCGNENDVCSNGICVTLPETIQEVSEEVQQSETQEQSEELITESPSEQEVQQSEIQEEQPSELDQSPPDQQEQTEQEPTITGNAISNFFRFVISGFQVEGGEGGSNGGGEGSSGSGENSGSGGESGSSGTGEGEQLSPPPNEETGEQRENRERDDRERREEEDRERRENECAERCDREFYDIKVRPYTENCIREECGQELDCNIDEVKISCEEKAKSETDENSFVNDCSTKCLAGENTWVEPERQEHKEEKFVFTVGGACRQEKDQISESIWFGGWGDEFRDFQIVKEKYYNWNGGDWCKREYENLLKQREALEKSLNEEFASWFFEDYVASSADDWENHISGIFDLYWRDVDLSRQLIERSECLENADPPSQNLINFEYETEYGSIEFWEEIKKAKISEEGEEVEIISPYMKTWLFPSRDFYKLEMKKAMESHRLPGPEGEGSSNSLTEEQRQRLIEDNILEDITHFNENFGESLVIQFKDYSTNEVVFNIYVKVNQDNLLSFEPMLPSENPAEDVRIEFDIEQLLDIVEYGESGRVELESPSWDPKPRTGAVENVVDGVKMYFMFRELMSSAITTPEEAEGLAIRFTRAFFEVVMGGDEDRQGEMQDEDNENQEQEGFEQRDPLTGNIISVY
ncbi:MAG: hypothetical protein AABW89_02140 [Nanoarchaeota archaeon]